MGLFVFHFETKASDQVRQKTIHVYFLSGFVNSDVTLVIDEKKVLKKIITTEPTSGIAAYIEYKIANDSVTLLIRCSGKKYSANLKEANGAYIGLSVNDRKIVLSQSKTPFLCD